MSSSGTTIVQPTLPVGILESHIPEYTIEMTLKLEHFTPVNEEEKLMTKYRAEKNNELMPTPQRSDCRIKVGSDEFFVHQSLLTAFSNVCKTSSKYNEDKIFDWSDIMTKESIQGLLRFIYFGETDAINSPEVAFLLLKFGHMYEEPTLFRICEKRLMSFGDERYTLPGILDMYVDVRIPDEFKALKCFFCGVLSRSIRYYDQIQMTTQAQGYKDELGVTILVEISQYTPEETANKKRRI